jgi:antitoxin component of MazEF toxin-antitoxin module
MLAMVKLTRNGNATTITVPRAIVDHLQWSPGEHVAIQVNANHTITVVRLDVPALLRAAREQISEPELAGPVV